MQGILIPQFWSISNLQKIIIIKIKNITICYSDLDVLTKLNIANTTKAQGNKAVCVFLLHVFIFDCIWMQKNVLPFLLFLLQIE